MAAPALKVYNADNEYQAATKSPEAAAAIVAGVGAPGWTIRFGHARKDIVWTEGQEAVPAGESFDIVASTIRDRLVRIPNRGTFVVNLLTGVDQRPEQFR